MGTPAEEAYARVVHDQEKEIYKQEATTDRKYVEAVQKYKGAQAALERSQAQIRKAELALAARVGTEHALVAEVKAQLASARLDLEWTRLYAPCDGIITDLQLREGAYTQTGRPAMTLIDTSRWLIVANLRENALVRLREAQSAEVAFRSLPGSVFGRHVVSIGWWVSQGQGVPSGRLPYVKVPTSWVPPGQRFQVRLTLGQLVAAYLTRIAGKYAYAGLQMGLVVPMLVVVPQAEFGELAPAAQRLESVLLGLVTSVVVAVLWPRFPLADRVAPAPPPKFPGEMDV